MTGLALLHAVGLGLGLGIVTGIPVAVINVAIASAASTGRGRFAIGLGIGGGAADTIHATLAFAGVGHVVTGNRDLVRILAVGSAIAIVAYAAFAWRERSRPVESPGARSAAEGRRGGLIDPRVAGHVQLTRGIATGFLLTLPNPAALGAWIAVAASAWPDATLTEAAVIGCGVGAGSILWFTSLARWISRVRRDHPALAWVPRIALIALVAIAVLGIVRAMTAAQA